MSGPVLLRSKEDEVRAASRETARREAAEAAREDRAERIRLEARIAAAERLARRETELREHAEARAAEADRLFKAQISSKAEAEAHAAEIAARLGAERTAREEAQRRLDEAAARHGEERKGREAAERELKELTARLARAEGAPRPQPVEGRPGADDRREPAGDRAAEPTASSVFHNFGARAAGESLPAGENGQSEVVDVAPRRASREIISISVGKPGTRSRSVEVVRAGVTASSRTVAGRSPDYRPAATASEMPRGTLTLSGYRANPERMMEAGQGFDNRTTADGGVVFKPPSELTPEQVQRERERIIGHPLVVDVVRAVTFLRQMTVKPDAVQRLIETLGSVRRRLSTIENQVMAAAAAQAG